jgi:hypothetical protein
MNTGNRRPTEHGQAERSGHGDSAASMMAMLVMMMSVCLGMVLLFAIIPALGLPVGLAIALVAGAMMLVVHGWMMRHSGR